MSGDTDSGNNATDVFPTTSGAPDTVYGGGTCVDNVGNNVPCTDAFIASYNAVRGRTLRFPRRRSVLRP